MMHTFRKNGLKVKMAIKLIGKKIISITAVNWAQKNIKKIQESAVHGNL